MRSNLGSWTWQKRTHKLLAFSNVRLEGGIKILKKRVKDGRQERLPTYNLALSLTLL